LTPYVEIDVEDGDTEGQIGIELCPSLQLREYVLGGD